ncbi:MAG: SPOR domain-containing protein [Gammaproteobacteria bacterium]
MSENTQNRWVWVLGSCVIFAFIVFIYYLSTLMPDALRSEVPDGKLAPHFTFYKELPNRSLSQVRQSIEQPGESYIQPANLNHDLYPELNSPLPDEIILQAGSYKLWQDADRRRAELALLGLESRVSKAKLNDGTTWYRIELGPFSSREALNHARNMLTINGVDYYQKKKASG